MLGRLPSTVLLIAGSSMVVGCTAQCGATPQRLAKLQRGMSYEETSSIMGCQGSNVTAYGPGSADYATVEWNGPDSTLFMRTRIDFLDGKLLSYTTETRGAL
jgi:hypothetical protein